MSIKVSLVTKCFIVNGDKEILILRRGKQHYVRPGEWDLPGGRIDEQEDPNLSLLREIKEEIKLIFNNPKVIFVSTETEPAYILTFFYKLEYTGGPIELSSEHTEYDWIDKDEFMKLELPEKFRRAAEFLEV